MTYNSLSHEYPYDEKWMKGSTEKYHYITWEFWHNDRYIYRTACGQKMDHRKPTKHPEVCCKVCTSSLRRRNRQEEDKAIKQMHGYLEIEKEQHKQIMRNLNKGE